MTGFSDSDFQKMSSYKVEYEGVLLEVDLVQNTRSVPEFFFHVHTKNKEQLLSKKIFGDQFVWLGAGNLKEAKKLGEAIEKSLGFELPLKETNNPFKYKGDIEVKIEKFIIKELIFDRAKAPFTNDIYYCVHLSKDRSITILKMEKGISGGDGPWLRDDDTNIDEEDFELVKGVLVAFETAYQENIYVPIDVILK